MANTCIIPLNDQAINYIALLQPNSLQVLDT